MRNTKPMVQRKRKGRGQAGSAPTCETNLPPRSKKLSRSEWSKWELSAIVIAGLLLLYILLCYEKFHFHVAHLYAHLGYPNAQHLVGQRYLKGAGVEKNEDMAMHWFRRFLPCKRGDRPQWANLLQYLLQCCTRLAAGQGHPHSSFNLAVGALKNMTMALEEGEVEKLLGVAADQGLQEAQELLENILKNRNLP